MDRAQEDKIAIYNNNSLYLQSEPIFEGGLFYHLFAPLGVSDLSDSWHEEIHFSLKSVFMVDVRFELTTNDPWSAVDAICEGISPLGYW